jgi:murein DD-endopeptidase MepM/ murein hydrolase activator NlpD
MKTYSYDSNRQTPAPAVNPTDDSPIYQGAKSPLPKIPQKKIMPIDKTGRLWPVFGAQITAAGSDFLGRREPVRAVDFRHAGIDVANTEWTAKNDDLRIVRAPETGRIVKSEIDALDSYGPWLMVLKGDSGVYHLLAHLSALPAERFVKVGDQVVPGQPLGKYSTVLKYKHLHWEVRPGLSWQGQNVPGTNEKLTSANKWRWTYDPVRWLRTGELLQGQYVDLNRLRGETYPIKLTEGRQTGPLVAITQSTIPISATLPGPSKNRPGVTSNSSAGLILLMLLAAGVYLIVSKTK